MLGIYVLVGIGSVLLCAFAAAQSCSLAQFEPKAAVRSQLIADDLGVVEDAVARTVGMHVIERGDGELLVSVSPSVRSLGRGYGAFVRARVEKRRVVLELQPKLALGSNPNRMLVHVDRDLRANAHAPLALAL